MSSGETAIRDAIYKCFDAGHDVGLRHEDGSLYSGTCHTCGVRYQRASSSTETVREEAIEAAAKALVDGDWEDAMWSERKSAVLRAKLALTFALPVLRRHIADEIAGLVPPCFELNFDGTEDKERSAYAEGIRAAYNAARGVVRDGDK